MQEEVLTITRLAGVLYKQGTTTDSVSFDWTNDTMAEYIEFTL